MEQASEQEVKLLKNLEAEYCSVLNSKIETDIEDIEIF